MAVALMLVVVLAFASPAGAQTRVHVFTKTNAAGFTDALQQQRERAVRDLQDSLRDKKGLVLAPDPASADVTVEILGTAKKETGTAHTLLSFIGSTTKKSLKPAIHAELCAGTYAVQFESVNQPSWKVAAKRLGDAVETWVQQNRAILEKHREIR